MLSSLRSLSLSGDPWPNYVRLEWDADDEEIRSPPTTHLVATVDDLTNMLDFGSEDIDGMDDDAGNEQEPPPTRHWTATSSYDIYMVDTPKEGDGDKTTEDNPSKKQSKHQRQRRRSKSRQSKSSDTGTGDNNTPDSAEDEDNPLQPGLEREDGQASPKEQATNGESEDDNYMPLSEDEVSLGDEEFIVPKDPVEQERFKRRLIGTAKSLENSSSSFKLIKTC